MRVAAAIVAGATFSTVGCGGDEFCTEIGAFSSVGVVLPDSTWRLTEFCIDDQCAPSAASGSGPAGEPGLVLVGNDPAEYEFRLSAVAPDGRLIEREGLVTTTEYFVNGKGCPPRTANASIVVNPQGDISTRHP